MMFEYLSATQSALTDHKASILAALQPRGSSSLRLSDDKIMHEILLIAWGIHAARSRTAKQGHRLTSRERRDHHLKLAETFKAARILLNDAVMNPDLEADFGWKYDCPADVTPRLYNDVIKPIVEIEEMALAAAKRVQVRRGPMSGNRGIPPSLVHRLAALYEDATGMKAGQPSNLAANDGPFFRFMQAVLGAVGGFDAEPATLRDAIRDALSDGAFSRRKADRRRRKATSQSRSKVVAVQ